MCDSKILYHGLAIFPTNISNMGPAVLSGSLFKAPVPGRPGDSKMGQLQCLALKCHNGPVLDVNGSLLVVERWLNGIYVVVSHDYNGGLMGVTGTLW